MEIVNLHQMSKPAFLKNSKNFNMSSAENITQIAKC